MAIAEKIVVLVVAAILCAVVGGSDLGRCTCVRDSLSIVRSVLYFFTTSF